MRILAVGKRHESWVQDGIERYQKRLKKPWNVEWVLLPHSAREGTAARQEESERILSRVHEDDFVVLLDERGTNLSSPALSQTLQGTLERSQNVVLVIGGAYGVNEALQQRANYIWSLSKLVLPHQLVRLVVIEQLYRAQEIAANNPYHHS